MTTVLLGFVGDVFVSRPTPGEVFREVLDVLHAPDILFGNLEGACTDDPRPVPSAYSELSAGAHNLDAYPTAGFHVMSMANNHILDVGYDAMLDSRARLRAQGVRTCGAGECLDAAREPAIMDADDLRIAFLAYASTFPVGYEARSNRPGVAPMRAYNLYNYWRDPVPVIHAPGMRPYVTTVPDRVDLAHLTEDIARARERADLVVTSFHWGDYTRPFHVTDHETRTARHCIDHGADLVIGHHHHALRGIEWYEGKPIMYGLGHFVFDSGAERNPASSKAWEAELDPGGHLAGSEYAIGPREGWPLLPMHEDTRMTMMAWAEASGDGAMEIGFLPCRLAPDGAVHSVDPGSPEGADIVRYLDECNRSQGLNGMIVAEGARRIAGRATLRVVPR